MQEGCTKWDSSLTGMFGLNGMARLGSHSTFLFFFFQFLTVFRDFVKGWGWVAIISFNGSIGI
jgi:hypothetical protein